MSILSRAFVSSSERFVALSYASSNEACALLAPRLISSCTSAASGLETTPDSGEYLRRAPFSLTAYSADVWAF